MTPDKAATFTSEGLVARMTEIFVEHVEKEITSGNDLDWTNLCKTSRRFLLKVVAHIEVENACLPIRERTHTHRVIVSHNQIIFAFSNRYVPLAELRQPVAKCDVFVCGEHYHLYLRRMNNNGLLK